MDNPLNVAMVTFIGVVCTALLTVIWQTFKSIKKRLDAIPEIISALSVVSKNMSSQTIATRYTIKAIRSQCHGSPDNALDHLGKAEDAINGRANENAEAAMAVPGVAV